MNILGCQLAMRGDDVMENVIISAVTAFVVSAIYNKVSAAHTFEKIDGYVRDVIELAKQSIRDAKLNN